MVLSDSIFLIFIMRYLLRSWLVSSDSHCTDLVWSLKGFLHTIFGLLLQGGLVTPPKVQRPPTSRTLASTMPKKVWHILCLDGVIVQVCQLRGSYSSYTLWHIISPSMLLPLQLTIWGELARKTLVVFLLGA